MIVERAQLLTPLASIFVYLLCVLFFESQTKLLVIFFTATIGIFIRFFIIRSYQILNILIAIYIMVDFIFRGFVFQFGSEVVAERLGHIDNDNAIYMLLLVVVTHEFIYFISDFFNGKRFLVKEWHKGLASRLKIKKFSIVFMILLGFFLILYNSTLYNYNLGIKDNIGSYYMVPIMGIFYGSISLLIYYILFYSSYNKRKKCIYIGMLLLLPILLMFIRPSKAQAFRPIFFTIIWLSLIFYHQRKALMGYMLGLLLSSYIALIWLKKYLSGALSTVNVESLTIMESIASYVDWAFNRFYGLDMLLAIFDYTKENSLKFGSTMIEIFYFWIPRGFWDEKPLSVTYEIGYELQPYLFDGHSGGFVATTLIGEFVINFGPILGILMYIFTLTTLLNLLTRVFNNRSLFKFLFPIFVFHLLFTLAGGLAPHFAMMLADIIPYTIVYFLGLKILISRKKDEYETVNDSNI